MERATFGAGCFWGVEAEFKKIQGVQATQVGYMGGTLENPTYEQVCSDKTGHVEVVRIEFDPNIVSYRELVKIFWNIHDPTQLNRHGPDKGTQYKSVIFYHNKDQKRTALELKKELERLKKFSKPIVTEIRAAKEFYLAEKYHQNYLENH